MISLPKVLRIEPAGACNLACTHCPTGQGIVGLVGIMKWETFEVLLSQIKDCDFSTVVLYHGGEPFLNKRLEDMVLAVKPLCDKTRIVTNGTLIDEARAKAIISVNPYNIEVSVTGEDAEANDNIRRGSRFKQILSAVKLLDKEVTRQKATTKLTVTNSVNTPKSREFMTKEFGSLANVKIRIEFMLTWPIQSLSLIKLPPKRNSCWILDETITVRWNGDVVPCCYDLASQAVVGNINICNLIDIYNGSEYADFRKKIDSYIPHELCNRCYILQ